MSLTSSNPCTAVYATRATIGGGTTGCSTRTAPLLPTRSTPPRVANPRPLLGAQGDATGVVVTPQGGSEGPRDGWRREEERSRGRAGSESQPARGVTCAREGLRRV